jgi:CRISPR-associated protein Csh1
MIYDLLDTYRNSDIGNRMAIESYKPKEGLYFRLYTDNIEADELLITKDFLPEGKLYNWFKAADYYSRLIEMNKPVDPKKQIHSNNIYSVYIKQNTLILDEQISPGVKESIERYYSVFEKSKDDKKIEKLITNFYLPEINKEIIQRNKTYILSKLDWIVNRVLSYKLKSNVYIKIFINTDMEEYKQESIRYLIPKIFNCNDYNVEIDGTIYGLSNINMGLNAKKPYLEHKTTNYKVPFMININDALDGKNLIEWLENQHRNDNKPILSGYMPINSKELFNLSEDITDSINSHYVHLEKGIKTIIEDYDFLPGIKDEIEPFNLKNYLRLPDFNEECIRSRRTLETIVDELLYNKNLIKNYYEDKPKIRTDFSSRQVDLLNMSKTAMHNYFRKCEDSSIRNCIDKVSFSLIKESLFICKYRLLEKSNVARAMNLRLSLMKYFRIGGKEDMGDIIKNLSQTLKEKIIDDKPGEDQQCSGDYEFYFDLGQLTKYLVSCSQAEKVNYSIIDPILNAKDSQKIKNEVIKLIKKYSYALNANSTRLNKLISMVMIYKPENATEVLYDAFLAGFASENIIYYKEE